jgi:hypothetical protein
MTDELIHQSHPDRNLGFTIRTTMLFEIKPHPHGIAIREFYAHQKCNCVFMAQREDGEFDMRCFFCSLCNQWFSLCGSSGNALKHARTRHIDHVFATEHEPIPTDEKRETTILDVARLFLEHDLPFSLAGSPLFRRITNTQFTRQAISDEIARERKRMDDVVIEELSTVSHAAITCDEWTDCGLNRYFGITALAVTPSGYRSFCLSHWPMDVTAGTAEALCEIMTTVLKYFFPGAQEKIEYLVTDTAAVMPRMVRLLSKKWMPCWAHVLNLMLTDILDQVTPMLRPILDLVRLTSCSTRWTGFVKEARYATLPTYTCTRWYSMQRLVQNALGLKTELTRFVEAQIQMRNENASPVPPEAWHTAEMLLPILNTFKYSIELLEADRMGSIAHVLEAEILVRKAIWEPFRLLARRQDRVLSEGQTQDQLPELPGMGAVMSGIRNGWIAARKRWTERLTPELKDTMLLGIMLNPNVDPFILSAQDRDQAQTVLKVRYDASKVPGHTSPSRQQKEDRAPGFTRRDLRPMQSEYDEWDDFLSIPRHDLDVDVYSWWERHRDRFPTFYLLAQQVLTIPATSASCERQFSKAKRLKNRSRWSLKPLKLGAMVVVAENRDLVQEAIARHRQVDNPPIRMDPVHSSTESDWN